MKPIIILLSLMLQISFLTSCKKNKEGPVVFETAFDIWYQHGEQNLFGPQNPTYNIDDVSLYYIINGASVLVNNGNLDASKGVRLYEDSENKANLLTIYPNDNLHDLKSETIIKIGKEITDTITCEFVKPNPSSLVVSKIWYNGSLEWDVSKGANNQFPDRRLFKVIK